MERENAHHCAVRAGAGGRRTESKAEPWYVCRAGSSRGHGSGWCPEDLDVPPVYTKYLISNC